MPRANVAEHLKSESRWDSMLLKLPPVVEVLEGVKRLATSAQQVPVNALGGLIKVDPDLLRKQNRTTLIKNGRTCLSFVDEVRAMEIIRGYLPRVLGWRPVATVAKELGLHRNQVESIVRLSGPATTLRLCLDKKLYISPAGEKLLARNKKRREAVKDHELLTTFAERVGLPANSIRAFFSVRKITLTPDIHGRRRLTDEQKNMVLAWRREVARKRNHEDIVIDGKQYRSIVKAAGDLADLLAARGTSRHNKIVSREYGSLRHAGRKGGVVVNTDLGMYVPSEYADVFKTSIARARAASLLGISSRTMRAWCRQNPELLAEPIPGRAERGFVNVAPLVRFAREKFQAEPHLRERSTRPSILLLHGIQELAQELATSPQELLKVLSVSGTERQAVLDTRKSVSRATYDAVAPILYGDRMRYDPIPLPPSIRALAEKNAKRLGLSKAEIFGLALSPSITRELATSESEPQVTSSMVQTLLKLSQLNPVSFRATAVVPGRSLRALLIEWAEREQVPVEKGLSLTGLPAAEQALVKRGVGELTGESALRLLSIVRMKKEQLITLGMLGPVLAPNPGQSRASMPKERAAHRKFSGVVLRDGAAVRNLFATIDESKLEEVDANHRLSAVCVSELINEVAHTRGIPASRLYAFTSVFFKASCVWEPSINTLVGALDEIGQERLFPIVVGEFLLAINDPKVRVYVYGTTLQAPTKGDIFVHTTMVDYGLVTDVEELEGGRVAVVNLKKQSKPLKFRIETPPYSIAVS